ncbi:conjugal transfer protein [Clostridioides difficile]|nr:conjugal transfer protein [Clostridioides difficile]
MAKENMPEYETIRAAVAGEKWAIEKVLECYSGELDKLATVETKQPDGSIKREIDEDMRQALALKLIEAIPQFPLEKG